MNDVVFTTYSFGELYCYQQERLRDSILQIYPEGNLRFYRDLHGASAPQEGRPPGSKTFHESMYGFKVHCVKNCLKEGFKKIIFLDAAIILEGEISNVLEKAHEIGVLAAVDHTELKNVTSDDCLKYVGRKREDLTETLVGGSVYIFDFTNPITEKVFDRWAQMEADGIFGCEKDDARGLLQGHRKDETCMSLALSENGIKPCGFDEIGYHNLGNESTNKKFTFYKLHFKGIGTVHEHSLNQSLIPLHGNILDLGCRDFIFTDFFRSQEYEVYPVDIGKFDGKYYRYAISHESGLCYCQDERDPDATHITYEDTGDQVVMLTIPEFSEAVDVKKWDLIKMDIEGAEFEILRQGKHPMASQICVEFHAHCTNQTKASLDKLLDYLEEFYEIYGRDWKEEHSAGFNYWDVLLIAR